MKMTKRWATIIGFVCGVELLAAFVIGGAGLAALISIEAAVIVALLGGVALSTVLDRRRRSLPVLDNDSDPAPAHWQWPAQVTL